MVYKRYIKKRGKKFGPYYYESHREGGIVKKRYIGGEKEYREWEKKNIHRKYRDSVERPNSVEQPKNRGKSVERPFYRSLSSKSFIILASVFLFLLVVFLIQRGDISGKVVQAVTGVSEQVSTPFFRYTSYVISQTVDESDEEVVEQFDKTIGLEIKEPPKLINEPITENKNKRMEFQTDYGTVRLYFDSLNYSKFIKNVDDIIKTEIGGDVAVTGGVEEQTEQQTGYGTNYITGFFTNIFRGFFGLVGRVVEDLNETNLEPIDIEEVREKIENLTDEELENIAEQSKIELGNEEFEIEVNETKARESNVEYKWGYKIAVKDMNFMAKVDISSDKPINLQDEHSLKIGDSILSFKDLVDSGYEVSAQKPALEIQTNLTVSTSRVTENITGIEDITKEVEEINLTEEVEEDKEETEEDIINKTKEEELEKEIESNITINKTKDSAEGPVEKAEKEKQKEEQKEKKDKKISKDTGQEQTGYGVAGVTGNVIRFIFSITGKITGAVVDIIIPKIQDVEYENKITFYIERDFNEINENIVSVEQLNLEQRETGYGSIEQPNIVKIVYKIHNKLVVNLTEDRAQLNNSSLEIDKGSSDSESNLINHNSESDMISDNINNEKNECLVHSNNICNNDYLSHTNQASESNPNLTSLKVNNLNNKKGGAEGVGRNLSTKQTIQTSFIILNDIDNDGKISIGDIIYLDPTLIIIKIIKAEHLDENRTFISDIYNETREKDDFWVLISDSHYVRATFETALDKTKDITVYARLFNYSCNERVVEECSEIVLVSECINENDETYACNETAESCENITIYDCPEINESDKGKVEVYLENSNEKIAEIENITREDYYKTYLDGLHGGVGLGDNESSSVFDLRIVGMSVWTNNSFIIDNKEIPYEIYEKKKRIDEIRRLLNQS